jgi:uncharacterized membrane protein
MSDTQATAASDNTGLKITLLIAYGLFVLALFNGVTALAGVVLVYVKRGEAQGTIWEGHARNLIRVFWISAFVLAVVVAVVLQGFGGMFYAVASNHDPAPALVGILILLVPALALVCLVFTVWYLYRTLRGAIRALEDKAY